MRVYVPLCSYKRDRTVCDVNDASVKREWDCTVKLTVRSVQRQTVGQRGCLEEVGSVPCVDCLMERSEAQHSEYERTQSATQRETAGMQQHRAAYMFKEAAAEWATDEVRKLK